MDFSITVNQFMDTYGLAAVFIIMLLKEIGLPIPIPSDLVMLGAAARAAEGRFSPLAVFLAILIPMIAGGLMQYALARGPGRRVIYRIGEYVGLTKDRLDRSTERVRRGGVAAVAVGLTTPGVRVAIIPAAGLADLPVSAFLPGLAAGSAVFLTLHFVIGYLSGWLLALASAPGIAFLAVTVLSAVAGLFAWRIVRDRRRLSLAETHAAWAHASCPVCLTAALVRTLRMDPVLRPQDGGLI